jgi:hypothetical protein
MASHRPARRCQAAASACDSSGGAAVGAWGGGRRSDERKPVGLGDLGCEQLLELVDHQRRHDLANSRCAWESRPAAPSRTS